MKTRWLVLASALAVLVLTAVAARPKPKIVGIQAKPVSMDMKAAATIIPRSGGAAQGEAVFDQVGGKVTLTLNLRNLRPGAHAVYLHENGDCSAPDASSAGDHWNPAHLEHGTWNTSPFHLGDIGALEVREDGSAALTLTTVEWEVGGGSHRDVVGRSIVVHAMAGRLDGQAAGDGRRIGCGVIALEP